MKGFAARIVGLLLLAFGWLPIAQAQPAVYTTNCTTAGCHVTPATPYPIQFNGAGSSTVIQEALDQNMTGLGAGVPALTGAEKTAIATYITGQLPATPTRTIPFQGLSLIHI